MPTADFALWYSYRGKKYKFDFVAAEMRQAQFNAASLKLSVVHSQDAPIGKINFSVGIT
jgi:hypothetical protein